MPYIRVLYISGRRGVAVYFVSGAWPYLEIDKLKSPHAFCIFNDNRFSGDWGKTVLIMRKLFGFLCVFAALLAGCADKYDDSEIRGDLAALEERVQTLETLCSQMNTNISSLQTLVNALQQGDYVTNVSPVTQEGETVGYTISFLKSAPITIYNGKDGEKGEKGEKGEIGYEI